MSESVKSESVNVREEFTARDKVLTFGLFVLTLALFIGSTFLPRPEAQDVAEYLASLVSWPHWTTILSAILEFGVLISWGCFAVTTRRDPLAGIWIVVAAILVTCYFRYFNLPVDRLEQLEVDLFSGVSADAKKEACTLQTTDPDVQKILARHCLKQ